MAMLAETKKKQKWTLNPRGSAWANDSSKFGEKLLRKMGWSDGQGLGAQKQGITEHIKVRVKHDSKGLGFKDNDQVWVEVENDFSNLLSKLSSQSEKPESEAPSMPEDAKESINTVNRSLEEKSKNSKARVHYKKFTRGKDLSRYSKKDLECIFGVSSKSAESKHKENKNFVQSGNMKEYFNKKNIKSKSDMESPAKEFQTELIEDEESDDIPKKKKKKGKKRKHEDTSDNTSSGCDITVRQGEIVDNTRTKNKEERNNDESEVKVKRTKKTEESLDTVENNGENSELSVKKKKKKKKPKPEFVIQQLDGHYDSSEVEEFILDPTQHLKSDCTANIDQSVKETFKGKTQFDCQISENPSSNRTKKNKKVKNIGLLGKVKNVLEASNNNELVENLSEKNKEMSKHVDEIVQAKISNYLSQVFNRKEKTINPAREMKEKKKQMIRDDESCVQFEGSNLCSIPGYASY